jgi:glycosyltransferase involved in cell wall biosynthesis
LNGGDKLLKVGWKVASLSPGMASVRYRALLPALALQDAGVKCVVFRTGLEVNLEGLDVLVIVKSFAAEDIILAQRAAERGIRVLFDLCDNIFIESYKSTKGAPTPVEVFCAIAAHVDCVVTTTEPLAGYVRSATPGVEVRVIPDGIETPQLVHQGTLLLQAAAATEKLQRLRMLRHKVRNVMRRVRAEGPRSIPPLMWYILWHVTHRVVQLVRSKRAHRAAPPKPVSPTDESRAETSRSAEVRRIVWFGNHGAPHARFGMLDLLEFKEALEAAAREFDVELVVISNNQEKYEKYIRPLAIASRYVEWSTQAVDNWLKRAAVVVVPNTLDLFSLCKSANRTVLAVARGVPVVATATPALEPLARHIHVGEPLDGLRRYLADPLAGKADAAAAFALARAAFGQDEIARAWLDLLTGLAQQERRGANFAPRCIVVLHLVQDLDLAVPVLDALAKEGVQAHAWCSVSLIRKSPRVMATLRSKAIPFRVLPDEGLAGGELPIGARVLLTVAETNLPPHQFSSKLSEIALSKGMAVATLQHGFENVGLTYDDEVHPLDQVTFKAQRIYIWGSKQTLHPRISDEVKERCIPAGCPKAAFAETADLSGLVPDGQAVVGIFENLHWHRYDDVYRQDFLEAVKTLAAQFAQVCFLVKPHHAGLWLTSRYEGERPNAPNLVIADPQSPIWENYTASALLGRMSAVVTTPSTVALDAARRGLPVAVFAGGLDLDNYAPLPLLQTPADWLAFVESALDAKARHELEKVSARFVDRVLIPGEAARRIAMDIVAIAQD